MTSHNDVQVRKLLKQTLDMSKDVVQIIQKVGKSTLHALINVILLNNQTKQLMTLIFKKEFKKERKKGAFSNAKILNQDVLDERRLN